MLVGYFEPYKEYKGTIEYSIKDGYYGKIICKDLVNYEANNVEKLYEEFKCAVNKYIKFKEVLKNEIF